MALCFEEGTKCYNFLTCKKTEEIIDQGTCVNLEKIFKFLECLQFTLENSKSANWNENR